MLWGSVFRRQNVTSVDVRFWRLKTVPALKGLSNKRLIYGKLISFVNLMEKASIIDACEVFAKISIIHALLIAHDQMLTAVS